jgi:hypothetical protein
MPIAFVSYAREDLAFVRTLIEALSDPNASGFKAERLSAGSVSGCAV